jgi:hypothetical protein
MTNKIFTFGDGFATGHLWPEWPQILQALLPDYQIINTAGIGAGYEFLVSGFVDHMHNMRDSTVIFQWPYLRRYDKLIQDNTWKHIIDKDSVYHFNIVTDTQNRRWWLSSASSAPEIQQYKNQYLQRMQDENRMRVYRELVTYTAASLNCKIVHTSSDDQEKFSQQPQFINLRQTEIQPAPAVHLDWLIEEILPKTEITIDYNRCQKLKQLIEQVQWIPYDVNQGDIWKDICAQL